MEYASAETGTGQNHLENAGAETCTSQNHLENARAKTCTGPNHLENASAETCTGPNHLGNARAETCTGPHHLEIAGAEIRTRSGQMADIFPHFRLSGRGMADIPPPMFSIDRLFVNHLSHRQISAEELRQFAEDHLGKLKALVSPPAAIAALAAPCQAAFAGFDAKLSARTVLLATQAGGTITKDEALQLIRSTVRQREGRIRDHFPKGSGPYTEFFPQGLTATTKATAAQITGVLDRLIAAADKYKTALGPELLAEFTALKATYAGAREGQLDAKGDLAQARADLAAARTVLELQLGRNILAIASHHLGHPERAADYFDQIPAGRPHPQRRRPGCPAAAHSTHTLIHFAHPQRRLPALRSRRFSFLFPFPGGLSQYPHAAHACPANLSPPWNSLITPNNKAWPILPGTPKSTKSPARKPTPPSGFCWQAAGQHWH